MRTKSGLSVIGDTGEPTNDVPFEQGQVDQEYWGNPEDTKAPEGLPEPTLWRVIVMPVQPPAMSKGGIALTYLSTDAESHLQVIGRLVALGPVAFKSDKFAAGPVDRERIALGQTVEGAPKLGDWVLYPKYSGSRLVFKGTKLVLMNDDEIQAVTSGPEGFRIYL